MPEHKVLWTIEQMDVLEWCEKYDGPPFHALLCDPPYHLTSGNVVTDWESMSAGRGRPNITRSKQGFMGKAWDGGDIAFRPETWAALAEHLLPGAFGMAFGSSRGYHRLACAIEDAGLRIHPSIFWVYASGFPKATRIRTGEEEDTGESKVLSDIRSGNMHPGRDTTRIYTRNIKRDTGMQAIWAGHRYGGQALKPAAEPIVVFQKPYRGKPVDSIVETGAGALWIDGGRINTRPRLTGTKNPDASAGSGNVYPGSNGRKQIWYDANPPTGRWPANLILSHSPDCVRVGERRVRANLATGGESKDGQIFGYGNDRGSEPRGYADSDGLETVADWQCAPGCAVLAMGAQSGESKSRIGMRGLQHSGRHGGLADLPPALAEGTNTERGHDDTGTAARFFFNADYVLENLEAADPAFYQAKAGRAERDAGLEGRPLVPCGSLDGGNDTRNGKDSPQLRDGRNTHPAIKPLSLCQHLATLLLPPPEYAPRRLLVPFCGTGSEIAGALLSGGWEEIIGIEREQEYADIGRARITYWQQHGPIKARKNKAGKGPKLPGIE